MFEESLVESTGRLRSNDRRPALISFAIQAAIAATIITIPLLRPGIIPVHALPPTLFAPPAQKAPVPPPQVQRVHVETMSTAVSVAPVPVENVRASSGINLHPRTLPEGDAPLAASVNMGSSGSNPLAGMGTGVGAGDAPDVVVARRPAAVGPVHISTGVSAGMLLLPIRPVYPVIAKASHTQGVVEVHAVISKTGQVERAEVVSGPPMLAGAALAAVREARYRPYLLNGLPTEVDTTFRIVFRLNGD